MNITIFVLLAVLEVKWFLVVLFVLHAISAGGLSSTALNLISSIVNLAFYGFIVDEAAGDGAGENRASWKTLVTISAREILLGQFTENKLEGLPLDSKIGLPHPSDFYRKRITIIIGGEMPHWGKMFRTAFENKCFFDHRLNLLLNRHYLLPPD